MFTHSTGQAQIGLSKGESIRAKIEANRLTRLAIAEAMKQEAGVTGHEINREDFSGLAFIGTGQIRSPEGQNMQQLYTVAHECGHIFLHNELPGQALPGHVMELEAESYAHQAFREHGMELPRVLSEWGRTYVGSWVQKDRAAGIAIDPRAEAYATGARSPYEPLRMVPSTWKLHSADEAADLSIPVRMDWLRPELQSLPEWRIVANALGSNLLYGTCFSYLALRTVGIWFEFPGLFEGRYYEPNWTAVWLSVVGGLVAANLSVLWRTVTRF